MLIPYSPKGEAIIGSFDNLVAVALGEVTREARDAPIKVEYEGETEVWWDEQVQKYADGEKLWVCAAHGIWKSSELKWLDSNTGQFVEVTYE